MKLKLIIFLVFVLQLSPASWAQHIRVRMNFPIGITINAPASRPYGGAVWIGPEWAWRGGTYVHVPGYWAKPRGRSQWVPGHWRYSRRGYTWVSGRWR